MSLRLTFQLYRDAEQLSVGQVLMRVFNVCANCTRHGWDFWRGVRSKLVEKQKKAHWLHSTVDAVPASLLQTVCRKADFCEPLDLTVVDRLFEQVKSGGAGQGSEPSSRGIQMLQARL